MRRLACLFLVVLVTGCASGPLHRSSAPEPVTLTARPARGVDYVTIVGDSDTSGSAEGGVGVAGWPFLITATLKDQGITIEPRVSADGSSGYVISKGARARSFEDRVSGAVGTNTRLLILFGSRNDEYAAPALASDQRLAAAVQGTLAIARERAPTALILLIGPAWTSWSTQDPSPAILLIRDTLAAEAAAAGATFVDPVAEQWFLGRPDLIGSDGLNPTDRGHAYMADRIAPIIAQLLRPSATVS